jgi:hypothetical protein
MFRFIILGCVTSSITLVFYGTEGVNWCISLQYTLTIVSTWRVTIDKPGATAACNVSKVASSHLTADVSKNARPAPSPVSTCGLR